MNTAWKSAIDAARRESTKPPTGSLTMEQLCSQQGLSESNMIRVVKKLIEVGKAERIHGRKMTSAGTIIACTYYRLVKSGVKKKGGK